MSFGGISYAPVPGSRIEIVHDPPTSADLAVWQLLSSPALPLLPIRENTPGVGDEAVFIGHGKSRSPGTISCDSFTGYDVVDPQIMRWGTNLVAGVNLTVSLLGFTTRSFFSNFDAPPLSGPDPRCQAGTDCPEA